MASIEAKVHTPRVVNYLKVELPGRAKPAMLALSAFSDEELKKVGEAYTAGLLARAKQMRENPELAGTEDGDEED